MQKDVLSSEVIREGEETTIRVNAAGLSIVPSIEDEELFMGKAVDLLIENPGATKIVFVQQRDYEYEYPQVKLLSEIASVYRRLIKRSGEFSLIKLQSMGTIIDSTKAYSEIYNIIYNKLKKDPAGAFVILKRAIRRERMLLEKLSEAQDRRSQYKYITLLENITEVIEKTQLIKQLDPHLAGLDVGSRDIYTRVFSANIKPDFMFTKLMASFPRGATEIASYNVGGSEIIIFSLENDIQYLYHVMPPEFKLDEARYQLLDQARTILSEHKPDKKEFTNPQRMREVFANVGKDLLEELASMHHIPLSEEDLNDLTQVLIRYTVGFGCRKSAEVPMSLQEELQMSKLPAPGVQLMLQLMPTREAVVRVQEKLFEAHGLTIQQIQQRAAHRAWGPHQGPPHLRDRAAHDLPFRQCDAPGGSTGRCRGCSSGWPTRRTAGSAAW